MYGDSRIPYPSFRAFTTLLEKHHYIESAIYRQCQHKGGRKITRSEFAAAKMVEGADAKAKPLGSIEGYLQSGASLPDIDYKALFPSL